MEKEKDEFASVRHLIGKHVKIIAKDHPWHGEVGHIKDWGRIPTGKPYCEVELDNGVCCCVFNGKELKYI
jgi:hypothetical protein